MPDNPFYRSRAWRTRRAQILARDRNKCQRCKQYGRTRQAQIVHHIVERDVAPERALDPKNLESVCRECHNALHPEKGGRSKNWHRSGQEAGGSPPLSPWP